MADSADRVFAQALQTVRRLPRSGSTRPPSAARLRLYGLYKQSMEGDVESLLPRPTLSPSPPPQQPTHTDPRSATASEDEAAARSSRHHREKEQSIRAEQGKWDAWHACRGVGRTDAKRRYIEVLIETMNLYAAGTPESRALVAELEFTWDQIRGQSYTHTQSSDGPLRVLSPMSSGHRDEIVEGREDTDDGGDRQPAVENRTKATTRPISSQKWHADIDRTLSKLSTEIAALREQVDDLHQTITSNKPSSSSFSSRSSSGRIGRKSPLRRLLLNRRSAPPFLLLLLLLIFWPLLRWRRRDGAERLKRGIARSCRRRWGFGHFLSVLSSRLSYFLARKTGGW